jgi:hypothetical protein
MSQVHCPHCGRQHVEGSAFCPETGQKIAPAAQPVAAQPAMAQGAAYAQPQGYPPQQGYAQPGGYGQAPGYAQPGYAQPGYPQAPAHAQPAGYPPPQALAQAAAPRGAVRHSYPLAIRDAGFGTAVGLMMKTLPYAIIRFGILVAVSIVTVIWYIVAFGGWALLGTKIHPFVGLAWFVAACGIYGYLWWLVVRYFLYLLKCGHIAVLTELITQGQIGNGSQGMFDYGKDVVKSRFAEVTVLFVIDRLVSGVVRAFNRTLDFVAGLLPIPGSRRSWASSTPSSTRRRLTSTKPSSRTGSPAARPTHGPAPRMASSTTRRTAKRS